MVSCSRTAPFLPSLSSALVNAVTEAEGGDGELDRHGGYVHGVGRGLEDLPAVLEDVVDDSLGTDARKVVTPDDPLVEGGHLPPGRREPLCGGCCRRKAVDNPAMEASERQMGLRDGEVLVASRLGDQCLALLCPCPGAHSRQSEPSMAAMSPIASVRPILRCRSSL